MTASTVAEDIDRTTYAVAAFVAEAMASRDVTHEELAKRIGIGSEALQNRLEGVTPFDLNQVARIANVFGMTMLELFEHAANEL